MIITEKEDKYILNIIQQKYEYSYIFFLHFKRKVISLFEQNRRLSGIVPCLKRLRFRMPSVYSSLRTGKLLRSKKNSSVYSKYPSFGISFSMLGTAKYLNSSVRKNNGEMGTASSNGDGIHDCGKIDPVSVAEKQGIHKTA